MARITVEDCLQFIPNRFELALAAAYRARQLAQAHRQSWNLGISHRDGLARNRCAACGPRDAKESADLSEQSRSAAVP